MKRVQRLLLWAVAGWILASILANRAFVSGLINVSVLFDLIENRCGDLSGENRGGFFRMIALRFMQTGGLALICAGRFASVGVRIILFLIGACASATLVILTWTRGAGGLVLFLCASLPQDLFYLASWFLLIAESVEYPQTVKRPYQRRIWVIAGLLCAVGTWVEFVIGDWILKNFVSF